MKATRDLMLICFRFLRKGRVGTYLEEMPQRFVEKFNAAEAAEDNEELRYHISAP